MVVRDERGDSAAGQSVFSVSLLSSPLFIFIQNLSVSQPVFMQMVVTQDHRPMTYAKMKGLLSFFSGKLILSSSRQVKFDR